jgi:hypothetical protein
LHRFRAWTFVRRHDREVNRLAALQRIPRRDTTSDENIPVPSLAR